MNPVKDLLEAVKKVSGPTLCLLCGGRIGPRGWVFVSLYERNANDPYRSGYICRGCQVKHHIGPESVKRTD